jgi:hypothetical protein
MADHAAPPATADSMPSPTSPEHEKSQAVKHHESHFTSGSSIESGDEPRPHLHLKTYLAVLSVCMIYFAQIYNLVGAGAVCLFHLIPPFSSG